MERESGTDHKSPFWADIKQLRAHQPHEDIDRGRDGVALSAMHRVRVIASKDNDSVPIGLLGNENEMDYHRSH